MSTKSAVSTDSRRRFTTPLWFERNIKYWFVMPTVVYLLLLGIFPLLFSLYLVFASWQPGAGGIQFIGLRNLQTLARDDRFWHSLWLTVYFVVVAVTVELILGLFLALVLQAKVKGSHFFRLAITLPILLTPIALSYTWRLMFDFTRGPINFFLNLIGLPGVMWLGNPDVVIYSIILVDIWQWTPFVALVLLAALEGQDVELYEAALVDGASFLDLLRYIALPLLAPFVVTITLLRSIEALKVFDTVFVLTGGGPGTASEVVTLYGYSAHFRTFNMGYLSAVSWVLLLMTIIVFIFFVRNFRRSRQT
jgi:multiple sugar transport system permease protein